MWVNHFNAISNEIFNLESFSNWTWWTWSSRIRC